MERFCRSLADYIILLFVLALSFHLSLARSYTAALGVTVGVGCLLLILNILIFAGIYYQRERSRRKIRLGRKSGADKAESAAEERRRSITGYPGEHSGQFKQSSDPF